MTKLKCPYCNKQIRHAITIDGHDFYWCENYDCDSSSEMVGTEEMWATVIDTKKKLDVALDWLKQVATPEKCDDELCCEFTKRKIAEIESITKGGDNGL